MNLNKVFLIGNLTRDPEMRALSSGKSVVNFGLATNRIWKNQNNERQQDTQFHNIVMFGKLAEIANQYLKKGSLTMIEGRINNRSWDGKDGVKRYTTEIIADAMQMGPKSVKFAASAVDPAEITRQAPPEEKLDTIEYPEENINPEDIPF
ncbi:MAG: single-stranded DNA-binding protein [Candidatus Niyogibacteria bacterium]|nr:single-stranded DNA-binding protein [Candidatus Niyogibacteria bacterium]